MQEWRTALQFLSRINRKRRGAKDHAELSSVFLDVPEQEVIDACLRGVLRGICPSLGHRMLVALANVMRLDIVLTTNFDDLLEQAFAMANVPLELFEVSLGGKLPAWSTISGRRVLIKLHGGRSSLRADYSTDELPTEEDKQAFLFYLLSARGREKFTRSLHPTLPTLKTDGTEEAIAFSPAQRFDYQNHLLVIGFSGNDRRIQAFIEYAMQKLDIGFKVYYLCYTEGDAKSVCKSVTGYINTYILYEIDNGETIIAQNNHIRQFQHKTIIRHTQAGLFLLQVYQILQRTLPPLGSVFRPYLGWFCHPTSPKL